MGLFGRLKNVAHPRKWKVSGDDVKSGAAAYFTGGWSAAAQEKYDKADPLDAGKSFYNDITGKTAADEAAAAAKKAKKQQIEEGHRGQEYTQEQVDAGKKYIAQGTATAANVLNEYDQRGRDAYGAAFDSGQAALGAGNQQARDDLSAAHNRMADLYGGGLASGFQTDPGYQFRLQQGENAIEHAASAAGGRHGGDTLKALAEYNQNFASNEFNNYAQRQMGMAGSADQFDYNRQAGLAGLASGYGQNAANMYGQYGSGMMNSYTGEAGGLSNLYSGQGQQAAGLGMQGAGINAGITQSMMGAMAAPPPQQGPSGMQQLAGGAALVAGTYFGGPAGGMVAKGAVDQMQAQPAGTYSV